MNNLDSIVKSRGITLLTKVCVVKAMVSAVVIHRCEVWAIKKAFKGTLESLLDFKEI